MARQITLFHLGVTHHQDLAQLLASEFRGQSVSVVRLEEFVITETPYRKSHLWAALGILEKSCAILVETKQTRRPGTFPLGTMIKFL